MQKYTVIIILVVIAFGAGGVIYSYSRNTPHATHRIDFAETGFSPQTSMIAKGDTITFTTSRAKPFWPASDIHPSHEIYSEFDPQKPIAADESWSFRFDKIGVWKFHDHLDPYFRGIIEVTDSRSVKSKTAAITNFDQACRDVIDAGKNLQCWQEAIQRQLLANNLDAAFSALDAFTKQNSSQLGDCHGLAHEIGEQAFRLFNNKKDFALSPKTSYCGYGFYHGFMETLVHTTNDMVQARAFCDYADVKLKYFIADAGGACIHGIGHGSVDDVPDPSVWGNMQAIVEPALALCERISVDESQLFRCASGAFNALEILSDSGKYKLTANRDDPFLICRSQPEKYKRACYTQFLIAAMFVSNNDFSRTAQFIDTIKEDAYAQETLAGLSVERVRFQKIDYNTTVQWCRSLASRFRISCITGFAEGFLKYGPPESEYIKAIEFCALPLLSEKEQKPCFDRVLSILRNFYTVIKSREICLSVEKQYQLNNCKYN
ncbi:MAG: hypothetical protein AAB975_01305 [Patescibacteria group bacterium]